MSRSEIEFFSFFSSVHSYHFLVSLVTSPTKGIRGEGWWDGPGPGLPGFFRQLLTSFKIFSVVDTRIGFHGVKRGVFVVNYIGVMVSIKMRSEL